MTTVETDTYLRLVADKRRRQLIQQLRQEANGQKTVDELVTQFHQGDVIPADARPSDRNQFAIELYHVHLPKLADHDVVEFDSETGAVRYQPDEQLEAVLDRLAKKESHGNC